MLLLRGVSAQGSPLFFNNITWRASDIKGMVMSQTIIDATAMLLGHGLDPNESNGKGHTFWTAFLRIAFDNQIRTATPAHNEVLRGVVYHFLIYGADPTSFAYSTSDGKLETWLTEPSSAAYEQNQHEQP